MKIYKNPRSVLFRCFFFSSLPTALHTCSFLKFVVVLRTLFFITSSQTMFSSQTQKSFSGILKTFSGWVCVSAHRTPNFTTLLLVADLKETKHEAFQISMVIVIGVKFTSNRNRNQKQAKEVKVWKMPDWLGKIKWNSWHQLNIDPTSISRR